MKTFNEYLKLKESKNYDKNRKRAAERAKERNAARDAAGMTGRREGETYTDSSGVRRHTSGAKMPKTNSETGTGHDS
jgi:hypothetical protein